MFIGSGHAAWHGAEDLVKAGKKVAIVEQELAGGTCTNYGCNAKFILDTPFEFLDDLNRYEQADIATVGTISWEKLMAYKKKIISTYAPLLEKKFEQSEITLLKGKGKLADAHTVVVNNQKYTSDYVVIGTGQHPNKLKISGSEFTHDSREFLDLDSLPKRITFIGAGIISMEFASIVIKEGIEVNIVEFADRALLAYPEKMVSAVVDKMTQEGVKFHFNQAVSKIVKENGSFKLITAQGLEIETDYIVDATGRSANTANLGLEDVGVKYNKNGIEVNDHLQTNVSNIFASGDVIDKSIPRLTPTATFESNYVASVILGNTKPITYPAIPNLVFTFPRIAQVGVSVKEATNQPDKYKIVEVPFGGPINFENKLEATAHFTFIVNKKDKTLTGAALLGNEAGEMINLVTIIIDKKLTFQDLNKMIFAFPATTDGLITALKTALA
ncbi:NAD(P)/FAD-dependent oxidoreductase [Lactobacillus sp. PV037]|uniref:dihydrolipoyl dehydrogenase family protein n=1 Tax=Lactobacillus sp. PV037 TaxID=2594496 RepID=UPI002ACD4498|nr:NAD(P)/FAD-dependent oxidoreductase [Lactobacillus sp. PV037]